MKILVGDRGRSVVHFGMVKKHSRRNFLRCAPLAAGALALPPAGAMYAEGFVETEHTPQPFKLFSARDAAAAMAALKTKPGSDSVYASPALPFTVVLTVEEKKSAAEFEYHEGRDHVVQVLEGETAYEVGGAPQQPRNTKPGEWLAPASEGATTLTLRKGDVLVIPRGTPHKRSTAASVTFYLISTTGEAKA
jgi:quercetin dioxygenase-like cupin family protein